MGGGKNRIKIIGVRSEESIKRSGRKVVDLGGKYGNVIHIIYNWSELDVWEFIRWNLIDYCSLYDEGYDRLGCVGCPLAGKNKMLKDFERWPLYKKSYLNAFDKMLAERKRKGRNTDWETAEQVMDWWIFDKKRENKGQIQFALNDAAGKSNVAEQENLL